MVKYQTEALLQQGRVNIHIYITHIYHSYAITDHIRSFIHLYYSPIRLFTHTIPMHLVPSIYICLSHSITTRYNNVFIYPVPESFHSPSSTHFVTASHLISSQSVSSICLRNYMCHRTSSWTFVIE